MTAFLRAAAEQTRLVPPATTPGVLDRAANQARADAARIAGGAPAAGGAGGPLERMVDDHFAGLQRLFQGEPPAIGETRKLFEELFTQLAAADAAKKSGTPPPAGGGAGAERVKIAAAQQPAAVRALVEQMADATGAVSRGAELGNLAAELQPITEFCNRAITNRYPFASGSRADVLPEDFGQLFGQGGLFDEFFQRRLAALVDTTRPVWAYRPLADGSRPVSPAALADFQRAQRIRETFFRAGGKAPAVRLELRLVELEPSLRELNLDIDGQVQKMTTTGPSIAVAWPSQRVASVIRLSTGLGDAGPSVRTEGPWALFRLFDSFQVQPGDVPERFGVILNLDGRRARLEVFAASVFNPFQMREIRQFRCPSAL
jgi:type VI secretion system protein ImpL